MTEIETPAQPRTRRALFVGLAAIAVLSLTACDSDPSARRVSQDIINTAAEDGDLTDAQRDCMLDRLDSYSDDDLEAITDSASESGPGTAIELFEADLASCR